MPSDPSTGSANRVDGAVRRHLERSDPETGLGNRLLLVEVLRSLAEPPEPVEIVHGLLVSLSDLHHALPADRSGDRGAAMLAFGEFLKEALPEGSIAASIGDGIALVLLPHRTAVATQAVAARVRALWLRRAWTVRTLSRPGLAVQVQPVPTASHGEGWLDRICAIAVGRRSAA
jgi:GGDEF domain-containing protein